MISLDDMHSEIMWFSWSRSSNYREKLRCHARDMRRTEDGKWKIEQWSEVGCTRLYWAILYCTGMYWTNWGGHWSGGSGDPGDPGDPGGQDDQPR